MSADGLEAGRRLNAAALAAAGWLGLAATPAFAAMALLAMVGSGDATGMAMPGSSPFGGMVTMYLLMAAFHAGPWLRLIAGRRDAACRRERPAAG
ncbi:MAG TPA: hypothetical protein VHD15_17605 [Hyphomicrobiales bacterium]|nr:hypothetical protein [Hyphomicrobiales bacterium]